MSETKQTTRRRLLTSAGVTIGAAWRGAAAAPRGAGKRPNVLFILTDDQRQDTVHARGNRVIQTPNLDTVVRSGVSFTNAYCMGGWSPAVCLPSRTMIHRGRGWFTAREQPESAPTLGTC